MFKDFAIFQKMKRARFTIIGGGIIGSAIARELAMRGNYKITVFEKERELGMHASGRNSGVLHSGINQKPGSFKAQMCLNGNQLARQFCKKHNVQMEECGTLVVAKNKNEESILEILLRNGSQVGVEGLRIIDGEELKAHEPNVIGFKALFSPYGAIVDSIAFVKAVAKEAVSHGVEFVMGAEVKAISKDAIHTTYGEFETGHIINCAGLYADVIAHMMRVEMPYTIIPFRGDYAKIQHHTIHSMVYQVPNLNFPFLGVHLTKTISGEVIAGPTAMFSFGRESYKKEINLHETISMIMSRNFWRLLIRPEFMLLVLHNGIISLSKKAFIEEIRKLCPEVMREDICPYRSGIRAQMVDRRGRMLDDTLVQFFPNSTHILNVVSPGLTSSLAFAKYVVDTIIFYRL